MNEKIRIDSPEQLITDLAELLGTTEAVRVLRLTQKNPGQVLSKMKTPPDLQNLENGGHYYSFLERIRFVGDKLTSMINRAHKAQNTEIEDSAIGFRQRLALFCADALECKMIPDEDWKMVKQVLDKFGLFVIALSSFIGGAIL